MKTTKSNRRNLIKSGKEREGILFKTNVVLLFALFLIIFILPGLPRQRELFISILLCTLVLSGLFAADFSRFAFRILFSIGMLVIMVTVLNLLFSNIQFLNPLTFVLNTLFFMVVTIALVAHVARAREVNRSTLISAINSYLLIGLTLSILSLILDLLVPDSFTQINAVEGGFSSFIYYGFVTLTTLGYGDITPDTPLARSLASFTALFGQLYLVIIMALIIGKFLSRNRATA
jgi:hypothetical protein